MPMPAASCWTATWTSTATSSNMLRISLLTSSRAARIPLTSMNTSNTTRPASTWVMTSFLYKTQPRVSRPAGLHHRPLAEPDVNLSAHPAPIKQTRQSNGLSVARIEVLLLPVASVMRRLDPTPSLQPRYEPSTLIRIGTLALQFSPLELLP